MLEAVVCIWWSYVRPVVLCLTPSVLTCSSTSSVARVGTSRICHISGKAAPALGELFRANSPPLKLGIGRTVALGVALGKGLSDGGDLSRTKMCLAHVSAPPAGWNHHELQMWINED